MDSDVIIWDVAQKIKAARKASKMTQKEVADRLFVSKQTYYKYESGKQNMSIDTLWKIGQALNVHLVVSFE